jgi:hypothetical protein
MVLALALSALLFVIASTVRSILSERSGRPKYLA